MRTETFKLMYHPANDKTADMKNIITCHRTLEPKISHLKTNYFNSGVCVLSLRRHSKHNKIIHQLLCHCGSYGNSAYKFYGIFGELMSTKKVA